MHAQEYEILRIMRKNPDADISTSLLVDLLYGEELRQMGQAADFGDKESQKRQKQRRAMLHRRILYHLGRLAADSVIVQSRQGNKGMKYFRLNLQEGEELVFGSRRRIVISRPASPATPIDGFEKQGIVHRYDPQTWTSRLNSVILNAHKIESLKEISKAAGELFIDLNDVLGINNSEILIQSSGANSHREFIYELRRGCEDFDKGATLIIDVKNILNESAVTLFLEELFRHSQNEITAVFETTPEDFRKYQGFFEKVLGLHQAARQTLYIKNKKLHQPPVIIGRAGPYTLSGTDWMFFKSREDAACIPVASSSIAVDVRAYFQRHSNITQFRRLIGNILKTLFYASSVQRAQSGQYRALLKLNPAGAPDMFRGCRNYIRFWNYGWKQKDLDQSFVIELIKSVRKEVHDFCLTQSTIYRACGMPSDFLVAFSCAFSGFCSSLSREDWKKTAVAGIGNLTQRPVREQLRAKEEIVNIFDGGDRMRFVRQAQGLPSEIFRELDHLLWGYRLPLICYDFGSKSGAFNARLDDFVGGANA